jgi:hypothetical protein
MKIPVFVSCPTKLNPTQMASRNVVMDLLDQFKMEPRALGRSDYPKTLPLKEVLIISKHCHGGVILGFEQLLIRDGVWKRGTKGDHGEKSVDPKKPVSLPTPWNHLEAGILFGLRLPLLVFREAGIEGGVFDLGTTEVYVHTMPSGKLTSSRRDELEHVFLKWSASVQTHYENI